MVSSMSSCAHSLLRFARLLVPLASFVVSAAETMPGPELATAAVNSFGLQLHRHLAATQPNANLLSSPFSIESALAMAYAGADGATLKEMGRVLALGPDEKRLQESFRQLGYTLRKTASDSNVPVTLNIAQRLFGQRGMVFEKGFLNQLVHVYRSPLETLDFSKNTAAARHINAWVSKETAGRIENLIQPDLISANTRLVLVNALHFKAAWDVAFTKNRTRTESFSLRPGSAVEVPTLVDTRSIGLRTFEGFSAVSLGYAQGKFQFIALVPTRVDGLAALESRLTPELLAQCAELPMQRVELHLPKLRIAGESIPLGKPLRELGLHSAFDEPPGSADFSRMSRPPKGAHLFISEVVHKTFLQLDEQGTEAAAATAVIMAVRSAMLPTAPPPVVRVDRPFLFAITERQTGVILFLGRVTDPR